MKRAAVILAAVVLLAAGAASAAGPSPLVVKLRAQVKQLRQQASDDQDTIDAQAATISTQSDALDAWRARWANRPDPLDVITARDPDGLWSAMTAIWRAMPVLDPGALCGYDKANVPPGDDPALVLTSYTFYRWTGC